MALREQPEKPVKFYGPPGAGAPLALQYYRLVA